jgi:hypothetical protein
MVIIGSLNTQYTGSYDTKQQATAAGIVAVNTPPERMPPKPPKMIAGSLRDGSRLAKSMS